MTDNETADLHTCETCSYWAGIEGKGIGICGAFGLETTEQGVNYITSYRSPNQERFKSLFTDGDYGCIEWANDEPDGMPLEDTLSP
jgi:hypothetical protein